MGVTTTHPTTRHDGSEYSACRSGRGNQCLDGHAAHQPHRLHPPSVFPQQYKAYNTKVAGQVLYTEIDAAIADVRGQRLHDASRHVISGMKLVRPPLGMLIVRLKRNKSYVLGSTRASINSSALKCLFSMPVWSARGRSIATDFLHRRDKLGRDRVVGQENAKDTSPDNSHATCNPEHPASGSNGQKVFRFPILSVP